MSCRLILFFIKISGLCPRNRIQRKPGAFRQFFPRNLHRIDPESILSGIVIAFDIRFVLIPQHFFHSFFKTFRQFHSHNNTRLLFFLSPVRSRGHLLRPTIARLPGFVQRKEQIEKSGSPPATAFRFLICRNRSVNLFLLRVTPYI